MTRNVINDPHDRLFQFTMSDMATARLFFEYYLPKASCNLLDLSTLSLAPTKYLSKELKKSESDIVYQVKGYHNETTFIILSEHQSTANPLMAYRTLKYNCDILDLWMKQSSEHTLKFPVVINTVVYHGKQNPYPYSDSVFDLFQSPELAKQHALTRFHLVDLTQVPDEQFQQQAKFGVMAFFQKHIFAKNLLPYVEQAMPLLQAVAKEDGGNFIQTMIDYITSAGEIPDTGQFIEMIQQTFPSEVNMASIAQQWLNEGEAIGLKRGREEGREEGLERGLEKGLERGATEKAQTIALNMLAEKTDIYFIERITGLSIEQIRALQKNASH